LRRPASTATHPLTILPSHFCPRFWVSKYPEGILAKLTVY
jgi:hypothetical protein